MSINPYAPPRTDPGHALPKRRRRSTWLAVVVAVIVKLGATLLLVSATLFGGRVWTTAVEAQHNWNAHIDDVSSGGWFALQGINFVGAVLAGWVCAWLAPARSLVAPGMLVVLGLVAVVFAQLPATGSPFVLAIWALGAPVGIVVGAAIHRRHEQPA